MYVAAMIPGWSLCHWTMVCSGVVDCNNEIQKAADGALARMKGAVPKAETLREIEGRARSLNWVILAHGREPSRRACGIIGVRLRSRHLRPGSVGKGTGNLRMAPHYFGT